MKILHIFPLVLIGLGIFALNQNGNSNSAGANPGNTGAPGESTCASSGCHDDNSLNGGPGNLTIKPTFDGDNITTYDTNTTITLKLALKDQQMNAAGFEMIALRVDNNNSVGNFKPQSDQQKTGFNNNYLTHTKAFTSFDGNTKTWTIKWESPDKIVGDIRFYAAGNAANNNNTSSGDYIYSTDTTLTYGELSSDKRVSLGQQTKVYPNPAKAFINIHLPANAEKNFQASLHTLKGKKVRSFDPVKVSKTPLKVRLPNNMKQGAYLLKLKSEEQVIQKKVLVR